MTFTSAELPDTERAGLPALVRGYLRRAIPSSEPVPAQVRITQTGTMWSKPGSRPLHFTASEWFAVERVGFCWSARFRIAPGVALKVRDGYDAGEGALRVKAFGVPIQRRSGPEVSVAEAYRYLAELPWVPHAMAVNRELEWTELDERSVEVGYPVHGERLTLRLDFDASGDIFRCSTGGRPSDDGTRLPWAGDFSDYRTLGGVRLPTFAEVYWDLPGDRFVYWRGAVTSVRVGGA